MAMAEKKALAEAIYTAAGPDACKGICSVQFVQHVLRICGSVRVMPIQHQYNTGMNTRWAEPTSTNLSMPHALMRCVLHGADPCNLVWAPVGYVTVRVECER